MKFGFAEEDKKLNMSQQRALIIKKTNQILGYIITNIASRSLYLAPVRIDSVVYRFRLSSSRKTLMYLSKASGCLPMWSGGWHI